MKLRLLFVLFSIVMIRNVNAQYGYITGIVTDKFGPLADVNVNIENTSYGTFTNSSGRFAFELDTGIYTLSINLAGYQKAEEVVKLTNLDQVDLEFGLQSTLLDAEVSLGSKSKNSQYQLDAPVPIDVVYGKDLLNSGYTKLTQALHHLLPNFFGVPQSTPDGSDFVDPISLRGLAADQVLVLVNGKRRHKSAFVHVNDIFGKGTAGTDLNCFPLIAIDKIEILKDGASSQYGSDAIAGVINIILKERTGVAKALILAGRTSSGDGLTQNISFNQGFDIKKKGFANITGSFQIKDNVNRAETYTGPIFGDERDLSPVERNKFFIQNEFMGHRANEIGIPGSRSSALFINAAFELTPNMELYTFGDMSYRRNRSRGVTRFPYESEFIVPELYPWGVSPLINAEIHDRSFVTGLRGVVNHWDLDLSFNSGNNQVEITVFDSNNASMGITSPISAYAGGYSYEHDIFSLDITRSFEKEKSSYEISCGSEFRLEKYRINEGETTSYLNGGLTGEDGDLKEGGIQGYHGISDDDRLSELRSNGSAFVEFGYGFRDKLLLKGALRLESYSDFGNHINYKMAVKYKFFNPLVIRGSISSGFKAPSLQQLYYRRTSTQLLDDELVDIINYNSESSVRKSFGFSDLGPELSNNISAGITSTINRNLSLSVDAFHIDISDRIILSSPIFLDDFPEIPHEDIHQGEVFLNAMSTTTNGLDVQLATRIQLNNLDLSFTSSCSIFETKISEDFSVQGLLNGQEDLIVDREERARMEVSVPGNQWRNALSIHWLGITVTADMVRYGAVSYRHPEDEFAQNWTVNEYSRQYESRDQLYSPKTISNIDLDLKFFKSVTLGLGANNIFDVYPDRNKHSENVSHGMLPYNLQARQIDLSGRFFYARVVVQL